MRDVCVEGRDIHNNKEGSVWEIMLGCFIQIVSGVFDVERKFRDVWLKMVIDELGYILSRMIDGADNRAPRVAWFVDLIYI